jgi:two-component system capsular synthesis sensor histidine kinase RcsC
VSNILIVEDNQDLCRIYAKILSDIGNHVCVATSLTEARQHLEVEAFDMVVCDMNLGAERGLDLIRQYHDLLLGGPTVTIVVSAEEQYRPTCEAMGVEWFLSKPVSIHALLRMVERLNMPQVVEK